MGSNPLSSSSCFRQPSLPPRPKHIFLALAQSGFRASAYEAEGRKFKSFTRGHSYFGVRAELATAPDCKSGVFGHAGFESLALHQFLSGNTSLLGLLAQLVEHFPVQDVVTGSTPVQAASTHAGMPPGAFLIPIGA